MDNKQYLLLLGKWFLLSIVFTICFILGTLISGLAAANPNPEDQAGGASFLILLVNSALTVALFAWPVLRSDWPRWKSMLTLSLVMFCLIALLPQLDSLFFRNPLGMSKGEVLTIIFSGAITTLLYIPISVWMLYPQRQAVAAADFQVTSPYWKMLILSLIYVGIYFAFGYYIAWQSADLREFYSGTSDIKAFGPHLLATWQESPSLFGLQIFRGLIWVLAAYFTGKMLKGPIWEKVLCISLLFSLTGALLLLIPNPYMPEVIRKVHFIEVVSSNLIWGFLAGIVLFWPEKKKSSVIMTKVTLKTED